MHERRLEIENAVRSYYRDKLERHGVSPRGVDWRDEAGQSLRFDRLLAIVDASSRSRVSLNDVGCGYGALASYARLHDFRGAYHGCDLSQEMVDAARSACASLDRVTFSQGSRPHEPADYSFASGLFNVRLGFADDPWQNYVLGILDTLAGASKRGFAFNALTRYSDPFARNEHLHYAQPEELFALCQQRYSRHVALLHDYGLYEFTIHVRFEG